MADQVNGNGAAQAADAAAAALTEADAMILYERLAALEMALESQGWRVLSGMADNEFSREGLRDITQFARIMAIKNPLIKRGVQVQRLYVFGQDFNVTAEDGDIDDLLTDFWDDSGNQAELTSHQALGQKETELQTDGNLFFVFFPNTVTGRVRVRSIPFEEVADRVSNPDDAREPWYYLRVWTQTWIDADGVTQTRQARAYYPDWRYNPTAKPQSLGGVTILWDAPVFHVRVGGYSNWKFGLSEVYDAIDWARAYKEFLEDWSSIVRAYRKFAFQLTTPGTKGALDAAKAKLGGVLGAAAAADMPPGVGSTFIGGPNAKIEPVRTSGATVGAEDARRLLLMVAASFGLPETYFGDASVGTLATAQSLDRPTELKMLDRQTLWADVLRAIHDYVLLWAVKAPRGPLRGLGRVATAVEDGLIREAVAWNNGVDSHVAVTFPPIVSDDLTVKVGAIIDAATLRGQALAGTVELPQLAAMLFAALGVKDSDELLAQMFPDGRVPEAEPAALPATPAPEAEPAQAVAAAEEGGPGMAEAIMVAAVQELRGALVKLSEGEGEA
jgi:hypothetical protein